MLNTINISRAKQIMLVYALLAISTLAVFWQLHNHEFVNLDDNVYVTENSYIQSGITLDGFRWAFGTTYAGFWHPLTWLSLMVDHQLYGLNAGGYHMTSLILHILSTLLLFWLFNRMTKSIWRSAFVAALFALHPLHVESVAWIAERKDVLSAFFWMLTLSLYVYYTEKPVLNRYLPVLFCFTLGLMSKSMLVTLPIIMILLDYWPLGRLRQQNIEVVSTENNQVNVEQRRGKRKKAKKAAQQKFFTPNIQKISEARFAGIIPLWQLREKIPFFILSIVFGIITLYAQKKISAESLPSGSRLANALVSYTTYLEKIFWPSELAVFYPFVEQLPVWKVLIAFVIIVLISSAVIMTIKRFPYLFVGWFWYLIILLPVIGIIQVGNHAIADRYAYLSSIGISIMLAWGIPQLFNSDGLRKKILLPVALAVIAILALLTWKQSSYWKNSITLYEHALQITENNDLVHYNLGLALDTEGKRQEAIYHYQTAIRINPQYWNAFYNLANVFKEQGNIEEAINNFREVLRINPDHVDAHNNLGIILEKQFGRYDEAISHYQSCLKIEPDNYGIHFNLGIALAKKGDIKEAITHFRQAIDLKPDFEDARRALRMALEMDQKRR
jgi:Tfp pilus assembly protein PilF